MLWAPQLSYKGYWLWELEVPVLLNIKEALRTYFDLNFLLTESCWFRMLKKNMMQTSNMKVLCYCDTLLFFECWHYIDYLLCKVLCWAQWLVINPTLLMKFKWTVNSPSYCSLLKMSLEKRYRGNVSIMHENCHCENLNFMENKFNFCYRLIINIVSIFISYNSKLKAHNKYIIVTLFHFTYISVIKILNKWNQNLSRHISNFNCITFIFKC